MSDKSESNGEAVLFAVLFFVGIFLTASCQARWAFESYNERKLFEKCIETERRICSTGDYRGILKMEESIEQD